MFWALSYIWVTHYVSPMSKRVILVFNDTLNLYYQLHREVKYITTKYNVINFYQKYIEVQYVIRFWKIMRICHDQIPLVGLWVWLYHDLFMSCHACQEYCCFSIKIWCVNNGENKTAPYCQTQQEQIKLIWLYRFDAKFSITSYLKTS